jgi:hypothetical protein
VYHKKQKASSANADSTSDSDDEGPKLVEVTCEEGFELVDVSSGELHTVPLSSRLAAAAACVLGVLLLVDLFCLHVSRSKYSGPCDSTGFGGQLACGGVARFQLSYFLLAQCTPWLGAAACYCPPPQHGAAIAAMSGGSFLRKEGSFTL